MFHFSASMKQDECYFIYIKHFKINFAFWMTTCMNLTRISYMINNELSINQSINQSINHDVIFHDCNSKQQYAHLLKNKYTNTYM